jgi:DNA mismatch repair protein MutL
VQRQALSHPDVSVRFVRDGEEQLSTPGSGSLLDAVYAVFGRQFALELTPVESRWEKYALSGYVTKPTATRGTRSWQQFFVNGRPVRSRLLSSALEEAYRNQIMVGRFPGCVLHLTLPRNAVDVNVHPAKTEVKFLSERAAFDAVHFGVLAALNKTPARPEMTLPPKAPSAPAPSAAPAAPAPRAKLPERKDFFRTMDAETYRALAPELAKPPRTQPSPAAVEKILGVADGVRLPEPRPAAPSPAPRPSPPEEPPAQESLPMPPARGWRVVGEVLDTYIIIEEGTDVLFLDKHAAHERILFEKLRAAQDGVMAQVLLAPVPAALSREETAAVLENAKTLHGFGFEVEEFGGGTVLVRQIPADLDEADAASALQELAAALLEGRSADPAALRDRLLHTIACKAAIKAGWHTEAAERDELVRQVMENPDIKYCPHGRPVCITLTKKQLEKQFKRT